MTEIIAFAFEHQFLAGLTTGAALFGGFGSLIGWSMGKADAMARAHSWIVNEDAVHGDVVVVSRRDRHFPGRP